MIRIDQSPSDVIDWRADLSLMHNNVWTVRDLGAIPGLTNVAGEYATTVAMVVDLVAEGIYDEGSAQQCGLRWQHFVTGTPSGWGEACETFAPVTRGTQVPFLLTRQARLHLVAGEKFRLLTLSQETGGGNAFAFARRVRVSVSGRIVG